MPAGRRPTVRSRRLGTTLRKYREAAGLDQEDAAKEIAGSKTKISRIEAGLVSARPGDVRLLLELYGISDRDVFKQLEQLAREATRGGWWLNFAMPDGTGDYVALESEATYLRSWQPVYVPGLLQTEPYTRALTTAHATTGEAESEMIVRIRQRRRENFLSSEARLAVVIGEFALRSAGLDIEVRSGQLRSLLTDMEHPHVTVQVLPETEWAATRCAPAFSMASFDGDWAPTAVGSDTLSQFAIVEDREEVSGAAHAFELLQMSALAPSDTQRYLEEHLATLEKESRQP